MNMEIEQQELPWVEKYRPKDFSEIVSHENILKTLTTFVQQKRLPHMLFYGPPGTGKTSMIQALCRQIYKNDYCKMVLELNASDERGINVVREQIKNFCSTQVIFSKGIKMIILDEADQITQAAQFALRRIIEKYTHTSRFCLICNQVSKIIPALQSRCTRFRFPPLQPKECQARLQVITQYENIAMQEQCIKAVVDACEGDMRRCVNVLQSVVLSFGRQNVTIENIYKSIGIPNPKQTEQIIEVFLNSTFNQAFDFVNNMKIEFGFSMSDIIKQVHQQLTQVEFPNNIHTEIMKRMAEIEQRVLIGANESIQLAALVGLFTQIKEMS